MNYQHVQDGIPNALLRRASEPDVDRVPVAIAPRCPAQSSHSDGSNGPASAHSASTNEQFGARTPIAWEPMLSTTLSFLFVKMIALANVKQCKIGFKKK
jgi:hypothetical protein